MIIHNFIPFNFKPSDVYTVHSTFSDNSLLVKPGSWQPGIELEWFYLSVHSVSCLQCYFQLSPGGGGGGGDNPPQKNTQNIKNMKMHRNYPPDMCPTQNLESRINTVVFDFVSRMCFVCCLSCLMLLRPRMSKYIMSFCILVFRPPLFSHLHDRPYVISEIQVSNFGLMIIDLIIFYLLLSTNSNSNKIMLFILNKC